MQTIRIILSASKSLRQERMELADLVENLNHSLESRNANILMLVWDGSESNLESFKENISDTDLCLTLYYDTFDDSTQSELETAYQSLCEGKNPKKIYVYFKDNENVSEKLQAFRDSFPTKYGHFYCSFSNIDTLKADFLLQFMEYQSKNLGSSKMLEVNNGKVTIDGKQYVDLKNVPFAGNNEEYNLLLKSIKKTQKLLAITEEDDPDYADYAADLQEMKEKLSKMESSLWDTALMITRLSTTKCSERLKRAMDLFTAGDNKGAQAVLNEEEIEHDVEHNLHLIQLGEEGKKGLKINIEEYELKIKTLKNEMSEGWLQRIIDIRRHIIELSKSVFGEYSEETAYAYAKAATSEIDAGQYKDAIELHKKSLHIRTNIFGNNHPYTASAYSNIGNNYNLLGEYQTATNYAKKALAIREETLGTQHIDTSISYNNLGSCYSSMGDYTKALEYSIKALEIAKNILGENHKLTATYYNNVGCDYDELEKYEEAIYYYTSSLNIRQKLYGKNHPSTASSYGCTGWCYCEMGNYKKGLEYMFMGLEIQKKLLGSIHPELAFIYNNIGVAFESMGDYSKALDYSVKALEIRIKFLGENHPDTAMSYGRIANEYRLMGNLKESLINQTKRKDILHLTNGPLYAFEDCYRMIAILLRNQGNYEESIKYSEIALEYSKQVYSNKPSWLANTYSCLANCQKEAGHYQEALHNYEKALNLYNSSESLDDIDITKNRINETLHMIEVK